MPKKPIITLKDRIKEIRLFHSRLIAATLLIALCIVLLFWRLIDLQVVKHDVYTTLSEQNQLTILPIEPKRGLIFDRNGVLLAENTPVFSLEIIPDFVDNIGKTISSLRKIIDISDDDIDEFYRQLNETRHFHTVTLKVRMSEEEVARFSTDQYRYPGIFVKPRLIRHYPEGSSLAHVIGYVGRITTKEWEHLDTSNYNGTEYLGKIGIEKYYENTLHGKSGYHQVETDASGRIVRELNRTPSIAGDNLYLTIDNNLQMAAEKALGNVPGAVVAIDPNNGEILALVSNPSYDPNQFLLGLTPTMYHQLATSPTKPLYNRALRGQYPMASTIKPYFALAGLADNFIDVNSAIIDHGYFQIPGVHHYYRDDAKYGHGAVNVSKAITVSCDTFFYTLAYRMGIERMDQFLANFGFGSLTNIDDTSEAPGVLASPAWKLKHKKKPWYLGDTVISGIGQGYMAATPVQLASAVASLAMHGYRYQPHLLFKRQSADGLISITPPTLINKINFAEEHWNIVIDAMQKVISEGTAKTRFGQATYTAAGKTGTAQVYTIKQSEENTPHKLVAYNLRNHGLFVVFAPVDHPKIAVAVVVEHDTIAPTVARAVLDAYLISKHLPQEHQK